MLRYVARRLMLMVVVVLGMSFVTFALTNVVPGDPARLLAGPRAREEQVQAYANQYGLDEPFLTQYWTYMSGLTRGDFGQSVTTRRPVREDIAQYLPATLELTGVSFFIIVVIGIPLGVLSAARRGSIFDQASRFLAIGGVSMPVFWLGLMLQLVLYGKFHILPVGGRLGTLDTEPQRRTGLYLIDSLLAGDIHLFWTSATHIILPATVLALGGLAVVMRMMRSSVLETLDSDFVRTARAKGLDERTLLTRHVVKVAFAPTLTVLGLQIGFLLSGSVLVEAVFNWPGLGLYAVSSIRNLDFAAIMGVTLIISVIYVVVNLIVDLLYVVLDPRITY